MTATYHYQSDHRKASLIVTETIDTITFKVECSSRGTRPDDKPLMAWLKSTMMQHCTPNETRQMRIVMGDQMEVILK
jgi:hypothetical protein